MKYVDFMCINRDISKPRQPVKKYKGDAGWDLFVSRPIMINPGETKDVHTDIKISIPPYMFARIVGRSSTLRNHKLMVNEGIIDNGYTGELFICVHNLGIEAFHVKQGMRLAQVIFHKIEDIRWAEVESINFKEGERGSNGFGSSGMYNITE